MEYSLAEILKKATKEHWSTGHFNISNPEQLRAIVEAAQNKKAPVLIGLSEGERKHIGLLEATALVGAYKKDYTIPIFLNADHSKSVESACAAVDAGFDSIHIDASEHPYQENIAMTYAVVEYAKKKNSNISIEGELGFVPGESKADQKEIAINESMYTNPDSVEDFVKQTGVNRLAIFVGNVHGLHKSEPKLDIARIAAIRGKLPEHVALVLHAGSGIPDEDIKKAVESGISNIHINTDIRVAYMEGLRKSLSEHPEETTPYKVTKEGAEAVRLLVEKKLVVFGSEGKI